MRTRFEIIHFDDSVIAIVDRCRDTTGFYLGNYQSITNGAEEVVEIFAPSLVSPKRRLIYLDTMGQWDEILVSNGKFMRFMPIGVRSLTAALYSIQQSSKGDKIADSG